HLVRWNAADQFSGWRREACRRPVAGLFHSGHRDCVSGQTHPGAVLRVVHQPMREITMKKITNARIYGQHEETSDILVAKGVITQIGQNLPKAHEEIDLHGRLVVPPYVDPHLHLDYVYTAGSEGAKNASGTLF